MLLAATALLASSGRADAQVVPMPVVPDPPSVTAVAKITPAQDMSAAIGQPIVGADAVLDANRWNDAPPAVPFKANERFSTARARQILAELLASGNYATGSIDAVTIGPGVRLAVHLTPRKIASNVRLLLHGAQLDDGELLRAGNLAQGAEVSGVSLEQSGKAIQMYAARHGYPDAEVTVVTTLADAAPGQAAPSPPADPRQCR